MKGQQGVLVLGIAIALSSPPSLLGSRLTPAPASAPVQQQASTSVQQSAIPGVLAAGTMLELVQEGFANLDGPAAGPDGFFYFSDVGVSELHRIGRDGTIEVFRDQSNGSTGLGFDAKGRLIALESIPGRVVAIDQKQNITVLTESPKSGSRYFLNDLVVDRRGGVYFTDAPPDNDPRASRVLYIKPDGQTVLITSTVARPTGIMLTGDGKTLLIADSGSISILAMDVQPDGTAVNPRPWLQLKNFPAGQTGGAEGLAVDSEDRLYVATILGVQVYSRTGEYLGSISVPRRPFNLAFGGADRKTLYVTARSGLYRIRTLGRSDGPSEIRKRKDIGAAAVRGQEAAIPSRSIWRKGHTEPQSF